VHVVCRVGGRSAQVTQYLIGQGVDAVNVSGGMLDWEAAGRPLVDGDGSEGYVSEYPPCAHFASRTLGDDSVSHRLSSGVTGCRAAAGPGQRGGAERRWSQRKAAPSGAAVAAGRLVVAMTVGAVTVGALYHLAMVFLHVAPPNTLSNEHAAAVSDYIYPEFEQNWKLFAPDPLQQNIHVQARAEVRKPDGSTRSPAGRHDRHRHHRHAPHPIPAIPSRTSCAAPGASTRQPQRPGAGHRGRPQHDEQYVSPADTSGAVRPKLNGGDVFGIQARSATTPVPQPSWIANPAPAATQYRVLPWWKVTAASSAGSSSDAPSDSPSSSSFSSSSGPPPAPRPPPRRPGRRTPRDRPHSRPAPGAVAPAPLASFIAGLSGAVARGLHRATESALGPYQSAIVRIGFSLTWLLYLLREFPHRAELYGPDGPWSFALAKQLIDGNHAFSVLMWTDRRAWFELVYALAIVASVILLLGWRTRTSALLFMIGVLSLQNRSVFIGDGGTTSSTSWRSTWPSPAAVRSGPSTTAGRYGRRPARRGRGRGASRSRSRSGSGRARPIRRPDPVRTWSASPCGRSSVPP